MRETRPLEYAGYVYLRITPAYAGNTSSILIISPAFRDHPRVCGKHIVFHRRRHNPPGSPPRMRETLQQLKIMLEKQGITPAYAGNTSDAGFNAVLAKDHPRVCGKHLVGAGNFNREEGSPPRMRETRD